MLSVTYSVSGIEEVERALQALRLDAIRSDIADVMDEIAGDAAAYPPPPAGSKYVRTNTLRAGWLSGQTRFTASGQTQLEAVRENATPYGGYVQGEDQAWMHVGRWRTTEQMMDAWEDRVAQAVEAGLERVFGS